MPAWFTVNGTPPIVSVPVRDAPALAATLNVVVPLPVPLAPPVIVSQVSLLVAVQLQPAAVVTATVLPGCRRGRQRLARRGERKRRRRRRPDSQVNV